MGHLQDEQLYEDKKSCTTVEPSLIRPLSGQDKMWSYINWLVVYYSLQAGIQCCSEVLIYG